MSESKFFLSLGVLHFRLYSASSLKDKRAVLKSAIRKALNNFNVSIAEVGAQNSHKESIVAFSLIANDKSFLNSKTDKLISFLSEKEGLDLVSSEYDIEVYSDF